MNSDNKDNDNKDSYVYNTDMIGKSATFDETYSHSGRGSSMIGTSSLPKAPRNLYGRKSDVGTIDEATLATYGVEDDDDFNDKFSPPPAKGYDKHDSIASGSIAPGLVSRIESMKTSGHDKQSIKYSSKNIKKLTSQAQHDAADLYFQSWNEQKKGNRFAIWLHDHRKFVSKQRLAQICWKIMIKTLFKSFVLPKD